MQLKREAQPLVEIKNLSFRYTGSVKALSQINLTIERADYLGIIGPNGGGKTTLLKLILGLLPSDRGTIKLFGQNIQNFHEWPRVGYVSQKAANFDSLFPATVEEIVLMGRYARRGLFKPLTLDDHHRVTGALKQVNLLGQKKCRIGDLSGGQQQRVFLARALASEPEIIMLDEPTTGVDQETQDQFYHLLKDLNQRLQLTLILISHDLTRVGREATRVAIVDKTLRYYRHPAEALRQEQQIEFHHHN